MLKSVVQKLKIWPNLDHLVQTGNKNVKIGNLNQKSLYNFKKPLLCVSKMSVTSKLKIWAYLDQILGLIGTMKKTNFDQRPINNFQKSLFCVNMVLKTFM